MFILPVETTSKTNKKRPQLKSLVFKAGLYY